MQNERNAIGAQPSHDCFTRLPLAEVNVEDGPVEGLQTVSFERLTAISRGYGPKAEIFAGELKVDGDERLVFQNENAFQRADPSSA